MLLLELVPGPEVFAFYFSEFFLELVVVDLVLDELLLVLLYFVVGLLEAGVELAALLGEAGILLPFCVQLPRQLHDALLLKGLFFHDIHINRPTALPLSHAEMGGC